MGTRHQWPRPRRDRDISLPRPRWDRDVGLTSRYETETRRLNLKTRPRRDVCRLWDVMETLKCTLSCSSKQVNVGLTTVATVTTCLLVSWCIPDFCVLNSGDYIQTVLCNYSLLVLVDEKVKFITPCFWKLSCYINTETDVPEHHQRWWLKPHSCQKNEELR